MATVWVTLAAMGVILALIQHRVLRAHLRSPPAAPGPGSRPPISVLKPLCGIDDDLAANLATFAALDYPDFEVLLGIRDPSDLAHSVAREAVRRWPGRFRLVQQRGEPGLNPKVNQLITLSAEARHDVLLVSDSNVRAPEGYLHDVAAHLADPTVGLVTHAVAGIGETTLGSALDNLQASAAVGPAALAAKVLTGRDVVVGKSMAFRRSDLAALGGFESVKDYLAEDYVLGVRVGSRLGRRVVIGSVALPTVSERRDIRAFLGRYGRWCVMQRKIAGAPLYAAQALLYPLPFALAAMAAQPGPETLAIGVLVWLAKALLDAATAKSLRGHGFGLRVLWLSPLKDLLFLAILARALVQDHVDWRGNLLLVHRGSRLEPVQRPSPRGGAAPNGPDRAVRTPDAPGQDSLSAPSMQPPAAARAA
jgi:ceramide glucosyltransferase